jgi:pimeloyl-ACP methyl ester carboxylesterase
VVITEAGDAPNVVGLVYIAAFIPDQGESAVSLLSTMSAANNDMAKAAGGAPVTAVAWHQKKSWALIATRDHNINPDLERTMAKRAGSETIEVPASHAVYVAKPDAVARLIERAAKASAQ